MQPEEDCVCVCVVLFFCFFFLKNSHLFMPVDGVRTVCVGVGVGNGQ